MYSLISQVQYIRRCLQFSTLVTRMCHYCTFESLPIVYVITVFAYACLYIIQLVIKPRAQATCPGAQEGLGPRLLVMPEACKRGKVLLDTPSLALQTSGRARLVTCMYVKCMYCQQVVTYTDMLDYSPIFSIN